MDDLDKMLAGLVWRPIAGYDRAVGQPVMLRAGARTAFGFWGAGRLGFVDRAEGNPPGSEPAWRDAQESMGEAILDFEPTEFAEVDDEWRVHLMAD